MSAADRTGTGGIRIHVGILFPFTKIIKTKTDSTWKMLADENLFT
jgi:hypothetical protein